MPPYLPITIGLPGNPFPQKKSESVKITTDFNKMLSPPLTRNWLNFLKVLKDFAALVPVLLSFPLAASK